MGVVNHRGQPPGKAKEDRQGQKMMEDQMEKKEKFLVFHFLHLPLQKQPYLMLLKLFI